MSFKQFWKDQDSAQNADKILFRVATDKEARGNHGKVLQSMPDKSGYEKVFMPYGPKGRGFYYSKL